MDNPAATSTTAEVSELRQRLAKLEDKVDALQKGYYFQRGVFVAGSSLGAVIVSLVVGWMGYETIWRIPREMEKAIAQTEVGQFKRAAERSAMDAQKAADAATDSAGAAGKVAELAQASKAVIDKIRHDVETGKDLNGKIAAVTNEALKAVNESIEPLADKMTRLTEGWFYIQSALTDRASPGGYLLDVKGGKPNGDPPIQLASSNASQPNRRWRLVLLDK